MELGIAGRVALVTAGSKGLGRGTAEALAADGAKVVICARSEDALRSTESAIRAMGTQVHVIAADVTDPRQPERLVAETVSVFGRLDILVANSGGPPRASALAVTDDQIVTAVNSNLTTSIRLVRAARPHMESAGWGRICLITSSSIKEPIPDLALSNLARTGLWAWAKTAAKELFPLGITLNLACPGLHATDRVKELGRLPDRVGDPADFGRLVAFLCSEPAGYIAGTAVVADGAAIHGLL